MKTKLEDFKKLKQLDRLDRIEYTLRLNRIEEKANDCWCYQFLWFILLPLLFISLLVPTMYSAFGELGVKVIVIVLNKTILYFKILGFLLGISVIHDIFVTIRGMRMEKDLHEEFFEVKTNAK